jgi:CheY-like chemotaxis protein/ribosomal protein S14
MIKAHSVSQEYWYLGKQKCECGGDIKLLFQAVTVRNQAPVDIHSTRCKQCGAPREFIFDISSFYKPYQSFRELAEVEALLKRVYPKSEVSIRMASPMEATLMFIGQLKESGDIVALEYIADAAQYAIRSATKEQASAPETVLVVEDSVELRDIIVQFLLDEKPGLCVDTASDGAEALDKIAERVPLLLITNVVMPRMDGFALLKTLHARGVHLPTLPRKVLSPRERSYFYKNHFVLSN